MIFLACAGVIWGAGIILSDSTDVLCRRLRPGEALGGVILLAVATNLPEIAITTSAALAHQVDIAVGNILGGIAIQTAVLALLDAAGVRPRRPLTHLASSLTLLLELTVNAVIHAPRVEQVTHLRYAPVNQCDPGLPDQGLPDDRLTSGHDEVASITNKPHHGQIHAAQRVCLRGPTVPAKRERPV